MKNLVIIISGPPGAGSSTIAKGVAKKLKLRYLSPGKIHKSFLKGEEAKAALDFWQTGFGYDKKLHEMLERYQKKEAEKGNIVICGKLSIHFLKKFSRFKIWLDAPLKVRARRTAKRDKIPVKEALKQISQREKLERKSWKKIYGFDYFKQKKEADLVVESSRMTITQTVNKILNFIKQKQSFNS